MCDLCKSLCGGRTDLFGWAVGSFQMGKARFKLGIATLQRIIFSVRNIRRILLMIRRICCAQQVSQPYSCLIGCRARQV